MYMAWALDVFLLFAQQPSSGALCVQVHIMLHMAGEHDEHGGRVRGYAGPGPGSVGTTAMQMRNVGAGGAIRASVSLARHVRLYVCMYPSMCCVRRAYVCVQLHVREGVSVCACGLAWRRPWWWWWWWWETGARRLLQWPWPRAVVPRMVHRRDRHSRGSARDSAATGDDVYWCRGFGEDIGSVSGAAGGGRGQGCLVGRAWPGGRGRGRGRGRGGRARVQAQVQRRRPCVSYAPSSAGQMLSVFVIRRHAGSSWPS